MAKQFITKNKEAYKAIRNSRAKDLRQQLVSSGLCGRCGKDKIYARSRCFRCWEKVREIEERSRKKKVASGKCPNCTRFLDSELKVCSVCYSSVNNYQTKLREKVIQAYGGKCTCCSESIIDFLCIDHIYLDGKVERKTVKGNQALYRKLIKENYPKDRYRILCFNCNMVSYRYGGICPHTFNLTETYKDIIKSME